MLAIRRTASREAACDTVMMALAVAYGVTASGFQAMIGDPLGPAVFPLVLAIFYLARRV